jgi:imidazolonepropionase-like amidohydrolase
MRRASLWPTDTRATSPATRAVIVGRARDAHVGVAASRPKGHQVTPDRRRRIRSLLLYASLALVLVVGLGLASLYLALRPESLPVPERGVRLVNVTVVNPLGGRLSGVDVTIRGSTIDRIAPTTADESEFGGFVLPGLIDLHVHHPPAPALFERDHYALLFLAHGVTAVRDTGSMVGDVRGHARRIVSGAIPGPRVFACGRILDAEPATWPGSRLVESPEEARRAVLEQAAAGFDCVKLYNALSPASFAAARDAAAARGLPVVAHVPWDVPFGELGAVEVQHLMGQSVYWEELTPDRVDAYVGKTVGQGISHVPTLVAFARSARLADVALLQAEPIARLLPPHYRERIWVPDRNPLVFELSPGGGSDVEERVPAMKRLVAALYAAGVPVMAGTDTLNPFVIPGASLHEELGHLADAGLGAEAAWAAATWRAGEALRVPGLGRVEGGAPADLLVFRSDPTLDLAALDSLEWVVADGRAYSRERLDHDVGVRVDGFEARLSRKVWGLVAEGVLDGLATLEQ